MPGKVPEDNSVKEEMERLRAENEALRHELDTTRQERDDYAAKVDEFMKDHKRWQEKSLTPEKRDRILQALGVGKQSSPYKRVKALLDQLIP